MHSFRIFSVVTAAMLAKCTAVSTSASRSWSVDASGTVKTSSPETRDSASLVETETGRACWKAKLIGAFMDVDVGCGFPEESEVVQEIQEREQDIVKVSSETYINPSKPLDLRVLPLTSTADDLKGSSIDELRQPHTDTCEGKIAAATSGLEIYNNIKAYVDSFDIFTKCTKTYVPNTEDGKPKMRKDDVIVIATEISPGYFTVSYQDVAYYKEKISSEDTWLHKFGVKENARKLTAVVTSRKENVIEGNYDVQVELFANGTVRLAYTKRQNLAEGVLRLASSKNGYVFATVDSLDNTMKKLSYAGLYGSAALDDNTGCFERKWCADYFKLQQGETCKVGRECASGKCVDNPKRCWWRCPKYVCA